MDYDAMIGRVADATGIERSQAEQVTHAVWGAVQEAVPAGDWRRQEPASERADGRLRRDPLDAGSETGPMTKPAGA
jgi:hypothetical protein